MLLSPGDRATDGGCELFLKYGAHANRTLFVEYGFVNALDTLDRNDSEGGELWEVDAQDVVEKLFADRGSVGEQMKATLEDEGYWG